MIGNYMMWRAARASLGYFTEEARKIQLDFAKNVTGKKSDTDRWKQCTGNFIIFSSKKCLSSLTWVYWFSRILAIDLKNRVNILSVQLAMTVNKAGSSKCGRYRHEPVYNLSYFFLLLLHYFDVWRNYFKEFVWDLN